MRLPSREKVHVEREVKTIQKLCGPRTHPNIVQVMNHGLLWSYPYYYIDMEICDMSLEDYLNQKTSPDPSVLLPCFVGGGGLDSLIQTWTIMSQIASGVQYIHCENQIHRDIKPANSMNVTWNKRLTCQFCIRLKPHCGRLQTLEYLSKDREKPTDSPHPRKELLESEEPALHTNRVDIWAMGCILYELLMGKKLFKTDFAVGLYVLSTKPLELDLDKTFDANSAQIMTHYIVDMLKIDPVERPSASTLSRNSIVNWHSHSRASCLAQCLP